MALPASDSFTDANGTVLTSHGTNWSNNRGSLVIQSNAVKGNVLNDDTAARWTADTPSNDQVAQITISAIASSSYIGVAVRLDSGGASTYYGYYASSNNRYFFKFVSTTYTDLQSPAGAGASLNDVLSLEVSGTTITPKRNGVLDSAFTPQTDSAIASGLFGVCAWTNTTTSGDNFVGNNLGGAASIAFLRRFRSFNGLIVR